mgnify:CR=1 FL=1
MTEYDPIQHVYEVRMGYRNGKGENVHTVYEATRTCTGGKWKMYHKSCSHLSSASREWEKQ